MKIRSLILMLLLAAGSALGAESLPEWLVPLRDAIFEQQLKADEVKPLYFAARMAASSRYSGAALDVAFSRCEFLMGQALLFENRNKEALVCYDEGMQLAERAIKAAPSSEAWQLRAENLSRACSIRPVPYVIANGLNVERYAKNSLSMNGRNAAAKYLVAARWIYAPSPFSDLKRGIEMMRAIPDSSDMGKDDFFNVYSAIGYAYLQQKKPEEGRPWLLKAQAFYPTNKYLAGLIEDANARLQGK